MDDAQDIDENIRRLTKMHEFVAQVAELVGGYRNGLVQKGISEETADRMAEAFHTIVVGQLQRKMAAGGGGNRAQRRATGR